MKCFIFSDKPGEFPDICGVSPIQDLITHLYSTGVSEIFCDSEEKFEGVVSMNYSNAGTILGTGWIAAFGGCITRQSPLELKEAAIASGALNTVSLSCSSKPWEQTTVLTDDFGFVAKHETNPTPENAETNLCFSGLVYVGAETFDPGNPYETTTGKTAAVLLPGYWKRPDNRENYLVTFHDILCGYVQPWPSHLIPSDGKYCISTLPSNTQVSGTLWVGINCLIEPGCVLENCVILNNTSIGENSNLRNCLVMPGHRIPRNTIQHDKYLSILGDENG